MATLWEYIVSKLRSEDDKKPTPVSEDQEQLRKVAKELPDAIMPNKALAMKRKQLADLDEQTKER